HFKFVQDPMPFQFADHWTEGHQTTLAALRTALGEDDLAAQLGPMEEQQRLHLVEVIARYGDAVLAASLPSLQAQVVALQTEVATLIESNNQGQHALQESQANALQLQQQLGQAVAAHPQDAAPATSGEPKKVRIDFPPFKKSDNENLLRWISHVSLAAKAMHLDDEGAVAKAVTSLLGRPAESVVIEKQLVSRPGHLFRCAHGFPCTSGQRLPEQNLVPQERPREVVDPRLRKQTAIHLHADDRPRQSERSNPRLRLYGRSRGKPLTKRIVSPHPQDF
ncbi:unnamed protein product, partial [Aphanomyces euteiches]